MCRDRQLKLTKLNCCLLILLFHLDGFVDTTQPSAGSQLENTSSDSPTGLSKWNDNNVRLLIEIYSEHKHLLKKGKISKKALFDKIAKEFNSKSNVTVTGEQCQRKWVKLEHKYKEVEDNNRQTGRARKNWKFMDEMDKYLADSPKVNPAYIFDTSSSTSSPVTSSFCSTDGNSNGDEDVTSDETNDHDVKKLKIRKRKRKSKSSAGEMLEFLKDYSEKREKAENQKVDLLREMHEEKKQFFSQFLDVLKNK